MTGASTVADTIGLPALSTGGLVMAYGIDTLVSVRETEPATASRLMALTQATATMRKWVCRSAAISECDMSASSNAIFAPRTGVAAAARQCGTNFFRYDEERPARAPATRRRMHENRRRMPLRNDHHRRRGRSRENRDLPLHRLPDRHRLGLPRLGSGAGHVIPDVRRAHHLPQDHGR